MKHATEACVPVCIPSPSFVLHTPLLEANLHFARFQLINVFSVAIDEAPR